MATRGARQRRCAPSLFPSRWGSILLKMPRSDADHDPSKEARAARKERMAKNERQHLQNVGQAQQGRSIAAAAAGTGTGTGARVERKKDIDRTLAMTRTSTASMGKFDRVLDGEKKLRGVKRKVPPCLTHLFPFLSRVLTTFAYSLTRPKSPSTQRGARIWPLSTR